MNGLRKSVLVLSFVCLIALGLLANCAQLNAPIAGNKSSPNAVGPLSVGVDGQGGGASVDRPKGYAHVTATFGAFLLCSTSGSAAISLDSVAFPKGSPPGVAAWIRTVTPDRVSLAEEGDRGHYAPIAFGLGSPPEFSQPYVGFETPPGEFSRSISGVRVSGDCDEVSAAVSALGRSQVPQTEIQELVIVIPSGKAGARIPNFTINYEADGEAFELKVSWDMVVCDRAGRLPYC
ncbi:hypothetical protein [Nocardioides bruguierae]|uniref:Uncharacterized protein n=1 Tax=Nocardioides bruguierae TaxID=2945102 RepID=A0A9X2DAS2_9ACTN|nr:hypothetical protein [Nocardioides bruguierae]MCM0621962.1 hypothetical protein [Nocardioides bruguierae]